MPRNGWLTASWALAFGPAFVIVALVPQAFPLLVPVHAAGVDGIGKRPTIGHAVCDPLIQALLGAPVHGDRVLCDGVALLDDLEGAFEQPRPRH